MLNIGTTYERPCPSSEPLAIAWKTYRYRAKKNLMRFTLPRRLFDDLVTDVCFYCLSPGSPLNGIDRVDNTKGYEENNVVTCCIRCNKAKGTSTKSEFENWAMRIGSNVFKHTSLTA